MTGQHGLQPFLDQFHVRLRRGDAGLGLLLERMCYMYRIAHLYCIDCPEGIAPVVFHQFVQTGAEAFSGLGRRRRAALLDDEQRDTHIPLYVDEKLLEVLLRGVFSAQQLAFLNHYHIRSDMSRKKLA